MLGVCLISLSGEWPVMAEYKFKMGQLLFPARSVGLNAPDGAFVVIKRLPMCDGEFEYQIKGVN